MSFAEEGFLSRDVPDLIKAIRGTNRAWLDLAYALNRVAASFIAGLRVPAEDNVSFVASLLFMRGISSFESAVLLVERGLTQDAKTLARGCFETAFYLGALRKDPTFIDDLIRDDADRRGKIARALTKLPEDSGLDVSQINLLRAFDESIKASDIQPKAIGIFAAAERAELVDIYNTYYRGLSNDSSHPSITALNRYVESLPSGAIVNLKWLPNPTDLEDAANNICTAAIYIIAYANEFFGDGGTPQSLADAWQSYKGLVEAS